MESSEWVRESSNELPTKTCLWNMNTFMNKIIISWEAKSFNESKYNNYITQLMYQSIKLKS